MVSKDSPPLVPRLSHHYGADHDHPGLRSDRCCVELVGGPLGGLLLFSALPG
ncbi:hypothetical protein ACWEQ7_06790 [Streptomyces sp. NPDC004069]